MLFSSPWTLASDRQLFERLESLSKEQCGRCERVLASLASLESDLTELETARKRAVVGALGELRRSEYVQVCQVLEPPPSYNRRLRSSEQQQPELEKHVPTQVHLEEFEIDPLNDGALPFVFGTAEFANSPSAGLLEEDVVSRPASPPRQDAVEEEEEDDLFTFSPPPPPPQPPVRAEHDKPVTSPLLAVFKAREPPPPVPTVPAVTPVPTVLAVPLPVPAARINNPSPVRVHNPPPVQLALGPATTTTAATTAAATTTTTTKLPRPALPKRPLETEELFRSAPFGETAPPKNSKPLFEDDLFASQDTATPPPPLALRAPSKLFDDDDDDEEEEDVFVY